MKFPKIKSHQHIVVQAELATGTVLNLDGKHYLDSGEWCLIFDSLEAARTFAVEKVAERAEIECNIYNHLNERILMLNSSKNHRF